MEIHLIIKKKKVLNSKNEQWKRRNENKILDLIEKYKFYYKCSKQSIDTSALSSMVT